MSRDRFASPIDTRQYIIGLYPNGRCRSLIGLESRQVSPVVVGDVEGVAEYRDAFLVVLASGGSCYRFRAQGGSVLFSVRCDCRRRAESFRLHFAEYVCVETVSYFLFLNHVGRRRSHGYDGGSDGAGRDELDDCREAGP